MLSISIAIISFLSQGFEGLAFIAIEGGFIAEKIINQVDNSATETQALLRQIEQLKAELKNKELEHEKKD